MKLCKIHRFLILGAIAAILITVKIVKSESWVDKARLDLNFIYSMLQLNHPGIYNPEDSSFTQTLENSYAQAKYSIDNIQSQNDYSYVLHSFVNQFHDSHLGLNIQQASSNNFWAGFLVACSGRPFKFKVIFSQIPEVPFGAELVHVDGQNPSDYLTKYIFPYRGDSTLAAWWYKNAHLLSCWKGFNQVPKADKYTFKFNDQIIEYTPIWQLVSGNELNSIVKNNYYTQPAEFKHEALDDMLWISLPSFQPDDKTQERNINDIITLLSTTKDQYKAIIFDVRGNTGGNSQWASKIVQALCGNDVFTSGMQRLYCNQYTYWRASEGNLQHLQSILPQLEKEFSFASEEVLWLKNIIFNMKSSNETADKFYIEPPEYTCPSSSALIKDSKTVAVIIDSMCVSACLDFIDMLKECTTCILFGQETGADSIYMEVRAVDLPSNTGTFNFPIKMISGRRRGNNQPYIPDYYISDITNTKLVKAIVLDSYKD